MTALVSILAALPADFAHGLSVIFAFLLALPGTGFAHPVVAGVLLGLAAVPVGAMVDRIRANRRTGKPMLYRGRHR
jgi:hypothetical protein